MGCRLWGRTESDTTEVTWHSISTVLKEKKKELQFNDVVVFKIDFSETGIASGNLSHRANVETPALW